MNISTIESNSIASINYMQFSTDVHYIKFSLAHRLLFHLSKLVFPFIPFHHSSFSMSSIFQSIFKGQKPVFFH